MSKSREKEKARKQGSKLLREVEINVLAEEKPDPKAYERFRRKPYSVGGGAIEQAHLD